MVRVIIDLDDKTVQKIDEQAVKEHRKRKPMIEVILQRFANGDVA